MIITNIFATSFRIQLFNTWKAMSLITSSNGLLRTKITWYTIHLLLKFEPFIINFRILRCCFLFHWMINTSKYLTSCFSKLVHLCHFDLITLRLNRKLWTSIRSSDTLRIILYFQIFLLSLSFISVWTFIIFIKSFLCLMDRLILLSKLSSNNRRPLGDTCFVCAHFKFVILIWKFE